MIIKTFFRTGKRMKRTSGFTLIELLVVVLIIGILAAIAVPQYFKVVEKGKFAEVMQWVSGLKGAQERYLAKNGVYATSLTVFDVSLGAMTKYTAAAPAATTTPSWSITMARNSPCPAVYGCYTVTFNSVNSPPITCSQSDCTNDLLPQ
ncbi:MAG: prepilin-type N-terminal cleavage/methylation domain-containing protein [Elusimicrobiota bacterium]